MPLYPKSTVVILAVASLASASAVSARPGDWNRGTSASQWGNSNWERGGSSWNRRSDDREGKVDANTFVTPGEGAQALGHGAIVVVFDPAAAPANNEGAAYEAAVIDRLVGAGYQTGGAPGAESQIAQLRIVRDVLVPPEGKRNPVSGVMDVGVSNRGTSMGLGINLDFSKPKKALVSTRLEASIRDKASGDVLWEGRADIATREGDDDWGDQAIAAKLADALFKQFPGATGSQYR